MNFRHILEKKKVEEGYSADRCVICLEQFDQSLPKVNVLEKGLANLIKISKERDMNALHKYLLDMRESNGKVSVHHQCRRKFTDTRKRKSSTFHSKRLRSSSDAPKFDWKEGCFLCSEKINKVLKNRNPYFKVGDFTDSRQSYHESKRKK